MDRQQLAKQLVGRLAQTLDFWCLRIRAAKNGSHVVDARKALVPQRAAGRPALPPGVKNLAAPQRAVLPGGDPRRAQHGESTMPDRPGPIFNFRL